MSTRPSHPAAKPCPFCGGTKVSTHEGSTFRWVYAACDECGAQAGEVRKQTLGEGNPEEWHQEVVRSALAEWNQRAPQQDGPSDRDAVLQAAMEEIAKEHLKEPQGAEDHSYDLGVTDSYCAVKRMLSKFAPAQPEAGADDARDAARYRYLRSAYPGDVEGYWWGYAASTNSDLSRLDAVIDAAIAKQDATDRREAMRKEVIGNATLYLGAL